MNSIVAPYLPPEELRSIADNVLKTHYPDGDLPIPIEHIVEFGFELDIVPMPGLQSEFDVEAYITNDLSEIRVDRFIFEKRLFRYRFSLAHELAHLLIHRDILRALKFSTIAEWKTAMSSIPDEQYKWIEWQAYELAGMLLVPQMPLGDIFQTKVAEAKRAGIDIQEMDQKFRRVIEANIGKHFEVSGDVIAKRMKRDRLWTTK